MNESLALNASVPIDDDFFCDGHYAVLLSQSLGGSGMDPHALADTLGMPSAQSMNALLRKGVCLPIFFGTDCALDGATTFVLGALDAAHEAAWIGRLTGKLSIPCGKLVLLAGGGAGDELARAVSGKPPSPDYCIYQTIDVPPGDYRVDVLAYRDSPTIGLMEEDLDDDALEEKYAHLPQVEEAYVIQLTPLQGNLPLPALVEDVGWPGMFEMRRV